MVPKLPGAAPNVGAAPPVGPVGAPNAGTGVWPNIEPLELAAVDGEFAPKLLEPKVAVAVLLAAPTAPKEPNVELLLTPADGLPKRLLLVLTALKAGELFLFTPPKLNAGAGVSVGFETGEVADPPKLNPEGVAAAAEPKIELAAAGDEAVFAANPPNVVGLSLEEGVTLEAAAPNTVGFAATLLWPKTKLEVEVDDAGRALLVVLVTAGLVADAPKLNEGATVAVVDGTIVLLAALEPAADAPKEKLGVIDGPVAF